MRTILGGIKAENFIFSYIDNENDRILVSSTVELEEAFRGKQGNVLKIFIEKVKKNKKPSNDVVNRRLLNLEIQQRVPLKNSVKTTEKENVLSSDRLLLNFDIQNKQPKLKKVQTRSSREFPKSNKTLFCDEIVNHDKSSLKSTETRVTSIEEMFPENFPVFKATVSPFQDKLKKLQDLGFGNQKKNVDCLLKTNGDLVEAVILLLKTK